MHIARAFGGITVVEYIGTICIRGNPNADPVTIEIAPKAGLLLEVDGQYGVSLKQVTVPASEVARMRRVAPQLFPAEEHWSPYPAHLQQTRWEKYRNQREREFDLAWAARYRKSEDQQ